MRGRQVDAQGPCYLLGGPLPQVVLSLRPVLGEFRHLFCMGSQMELLSLIQPSSHLSHLPWAG